jgi:shikimate dehydrogenase
MYFIGVSTAQSAVHRLFPCWLEATGQAPAQLVGIDIPVDAPPQSYHVAIHKMLRDPLCMGALVTTHKVAIYREAASFFTDFDDDARMLGEVGCIVRRGVSLTGLALDTVTAGLAVESVLAKAVEPVRAALILGAGGAGVALALYLARQRPMIEVTLTDASPERVEHVRNISPLGCLLTDSSDALLDALAPGSLIVNATGMGKDRPGCPITERARFPQHALAWDFNYRGDLQFLAHARAQGALAIDGWEYFIHGWTQIMSKVLGFELTSERFKGMAETATR